MLLNLNSYHESIILQPLNKGEQGRFLAQFVFDLRWVLEDHNFCPADEYPRLLCNFENFPVTLASTFDELGVHELGMSMGTRRYVYREV